MSEFHWRHPIPCTEKLSGKHTSVFAVSPTTWICGGFRLVTSPRSEGPGVPILSCLWGWGGGSKITQLPSVLIGSFYCCFHLFCCCCQDSFFREVLDSQQNLERYRVPIQSLTPHRYHPPDIISISCQSVTFLTTMTHPHPEPGVYPRVHSGCDTFYGIGTKLMTCTHHCNII